MWIVLTILFLIWFDFVDCLLLLNVAVVFGCVVILLLILLMFCLVVLNWFGSDFVIALVYLLCFVYCYYRFVDLIAYSCLFPVLFGLLTFWLWIFMRCWLMFWYYICFLTCVLMLFVLYVVHVKFCCLYSSFGVCLQFGFVLLWCFTLLFVCVVDLIVGGLGFLFYFRASWLLGVFRLNVLFIFVVYLLCIAWLCCYVWRFGFGG